MSKLIRRKSSTNGNGTPTPRLEPTVAYEVIDREKALELLQFNTNNRRVQKPEVARIADDLVAGRFLPRVADIRVSANGVLLDGQHTLLAIVETGVSATCTVHRNASESEWSVIDAGTKRTVGQSLARMGHPNAADLGTTARCVLVWRTTGFPSVASDGRVFSRTLTNSRIIEYADNHADELLPFIRQAQRRISDKPLLPRCWVAALTVALSDADAELGNAFLEQVFGEADEADTMALLLRERLSSIAMKSREHRPGTAVLLAMSIKAFNAWVSGREIKTLMWRPNEDFPQITIPEGVN
jgi:hypothetical protein